MARSEPRHYITIIRLPIGCKPETILTPHQSASTNHLSSDLICSRCTIVILTKFRKKEVTSFFGSIRLSSVRHANWESINNATTSSISLSGIPHASVKSETDFLPSINCLIVDFTINFTSEL